MQVNLYRCPECGREWMEVWEGGCDSECPACKASDISPIDSVSQAELFEGE
jgi:hypothetical protein